MEKIAKILKSLKMEAEINYDGWNFSYNTIIKIADKTKEISDEDCVSAEQVDNVLLAITELYG